MAERRVTAMYMQPFEEPVEITSGGWSSKKKASPKSEGIAVDLEAHYPASEGWRVVGHSIFPSRYFDISEAIPEMYPVPGQDKVIYYLTVLLEKVEQIPEG